MDFVGGSESRSANADPEVMLQNLKEELVFQKDAEYKAKILDAQKDHRRRQTAAKRTIAELELDRSNLQQEVDKLREQNKIALTGLYDSLLLRFNNVEKTVKKIASLVFAVVTFITSSILLDRIDSFTKYHLSLVLSFLVAVVAGAGIFIDPRNFLERTLSRYFEKEFRANVASLLPWVNMSSMIVSFLPVRLELDGKVIKPEGHKGLTPYFSP